jgi:hypothetical protein
MEQPGLPFLPAMGTYRLTASFLHFFLAPVLGAFSGFHMASYLLVGLYTWPRTSRVIVLTIGMLIFSYEFIYKNNLSRPTSNWRHSSLESVLYTCVIPYMIGGGALLVIAGLSN